MWQRHTQPLALSGTRPNSAAGCGSCTRHTSQPPESSRAFISLYCSHVAHCSSSRSCGAPWRAFVNQLGRVKDPLAPVDHLPLAVQADVAHQRYERVEDLRDASAEG